jgi:hypothetical protein
VQMNSRLMNISYFKKSFLCFKRPQTITLSDQFRDCQGHKVDVRVHRAGDRTGVISTVDVIQNLIIPEGQFVPQRDLPRTPWHDWSYRRD